MINYTEFKTIAFTGWGIPTELLDNVQNWVENDREHKWYIKDPSYRSGQPNSDLGYAELRDITTVDRGMREIKEAIDWALQEQRLEKNNAYRRLLKKPGNYLQRVALKTYWLARQQ